MDFEELARMWRKQDAGPLVDDESALVQRLRQEHQREERRLVWLNFQEGIPSLLLFIFFFAVGLKVDDGSWAWFTAAVLCLGVGAFLLAATLRHRALQRGFADSVKDMLRRSLEQAKQREWLYRNVFWWYLLPISLGLAAIVYQIMLRDGINAWEFGYISCAVVLYWVIYRANRRIALRHYQPARQRLEAMLQCMGEGQGNDV